MRVVTFETVTIKRIIGDKHKHKEQNTLNDQSHIIVTFITFVDVNCHIEENNAKYKDNDNDKDKGYEGYEKDTLTEQSPNSTRLPFSFENILLEGCISAKILSKGGLSLDPIYVIPHQLRTK